MVVNTYIPEAKEMEVTVSVIQGHHHNFEVSLDHMRPNLRK